MILSENYKPGHFHEYVVQIANYYWLAKYPLHPRKLAKLGIFPLTKNFIFIMII